MLRPTGLPSADHPAPVKSRRARIAFFFLACWGVAFGLCWFGHAFIRAADQFILVVPGMELNWQAAIVISLLIVTLVAGGYWYLASDALLGWWWSSRAVLLWSVMYLFHGAVDLIIWVLGLPFSTLTGFLVVLVAAPLIGSFHRAFVRLLRWVSRILLTWAARPAVIFGLEHLLLHLKQHSKPPASSTS